MKHFIEDYRNNQIFYDESNDKFVCEILSDDELKPKTMNRASLVDVRKAIDDYFKRNSTFKPFKALYSYFSDGSDIREVTIVAVRKDGGVTVTNTKGEREQIILDVNKLRKYSETFINENSQIAMQIDELDRQKTALKKRIFEIMPEKLDLSFINNFK
jgi:hypothetical protein